MEHHYHITYRNRGAGNKRKSERDKKKSNAVKPPSICLFQETRPRIIQREGKVANLIRTEDVKNAGSYHCKNLIEKKSLERIVKSGKRSKGFNINNFAHKDQILKLILLPLTTQCFSMVKSQEYYNGRK